MQLLRFASIASASEAAAGKACRSEVTANAAAAATVCYTVAADAASVAACTASSSETAPGRDDPVPEMRVKVGDPVWVRNTKKGAADPFSAGTIVNVQQGGARLTVKLPNGTEQPYDTRHADLFLSNPADSTAPDHCALIHLNEPCAALLHIDDRPR